MTEPQRRATVDPSGKPTEFDTRLQAFIDSLPGDFFTVHVRGLDTSVTKVYGPYNDAELWSLCAAPDIEAETLKLHQALRDGNPYKPVSAKQRQLAAIRLFVKAQTLLFGRSQTEAIERAIPFTDYRAGPEGQDFENQVRSIKRVLSKDRTISS